MRLSRSTQDLDHQTILIISFSILGFLHLIKKLLKFTKWIYCMFLRPSKKLTTYGSWAMITGSTDGIGKALSFELASKGLNLILVGRSSQKLELISNEIWEKCGKNTHIKIIVLDFAKVSGEEVVEKIREETLGLDVGVLVNNVGCSSKGARFFHEVDFDGVDELVSVNVGGVSWVTKGVIDGMLTRKKGVVVNVGSGSSVAVPSYPFYSVYAATKAYVAMFSRCLNLEYQHHGIDIQCQIPLLVATKLASIKKTSFFVPSPQQYSKASIRWIGYEFLCVPYWPHALQCFLMDALPDSLVNWLLFRYFFNLRKKVLRKELLK